MTQRVTQEGVSLDKNLIGHYARPQISGTVPAVVVIMEAFGLNNNIKGVCQRLAEAGYAALAPDYYHGDVYAYADREKAMAKLQGLNDDQVMRETAKGLDFLAQHTEVAANRTGVLGFCMGGRLAFLASAAHADRIQAAVCFYGGGIGPLEPRLGRKPLLDRIPAIKAPLLLVYGAKDTSITPDEHGRIAQALSEANKRYTLSVFPDAGHAFATVDRDSYRPQPAEQAWRLTMAFFAAALG